MRILKDADGDLWEERANGLWDCRTEDTPPQGLARITEHYGPVQIFGQGSTKDTSVYRMTSSGGSVKYANRRVLAATLASHGYRTWVKVERASEIEWADVTAEFLKP